jgi:hypothetical protein
MDFCPKCKLQKGSTKFVWETCDTVKSGKNLDLGGCGKDFTIKVVPFVTMKKCHKCDMSDDSDDVKAAFEDPAECPTPFPNFG